MRSRSAILLAAGISVFMLAACGGDASDVIPNLAFRDMGVSVEGTPEPLDIQSLPMNEVTEQNQTEQNEEQEMPTEEPMQESPTEEPPQESPTEEPLQESPTEEPPQEPPALYITISAAGDVTLGNYFDQEYQGSFRATYSKQQNPAYFFENVYDIFSQDDMTIVNLEGPLTYAEERREEQTYCISGDPEYVDILTAGSVEAVSMGNNHRLDYFEKGSADTMEALKSVGIPYAYDMHTGTYETQGILIGFVSVNEVGQGPGVEKYLKEGIESLKEEGCQLILACCHWGVEREYYPEDYQKSLGKQCIDWGADLVIGHHPHVLQGIEEYQGKYIVYSLGNFCFGANRNPPDKDCLIIQQTFTFVDGEKQEETTFKVIPCSVSSITERNDFKPTPAQGEETQRILEKLNEYSKDLGLQFDENGYPII